MTATKGGLTNLVQSSEQYMINTNFEFLASLNLGIFLRAHCVLHCIQIPYILYKVPVLGQNAKKDLPCEKMDSLFNHDGVLLGIVGTSILTSPSPLDVQARHKAGAVMNLIDQSS
jgi:hypothetical protein